MPLLRLTSLLLLLLSLAAAAEEGSWRGAMQDGSEITIDPSTNKATRTLDGETTLLWNGVHRLSNGAVIIVRDGVVVPDQAIIEAQQEQARNRLNAACMQLVSKVCGQHSECRSQPACDPARQLLAMEREELGSSWSGASLESPHLCLEALGNEAYFTPCVRRDPKERPSACEQLAARVCGEAEGCADSQGCGAARQLISMERQDLVEAPQRHSTASAQCGEMLERPTETFDACRR